MWYLCGFPALLKARRACSALSLCTELKCTEKKRKWWQAHKSFLNIEFSKDSLGSSSWSLVVLEHEADCDAVAGHNYL